MSTESVKKSESVKKIESALNSIDDAIVVVAGKKESVTDSFILTFYDALYSVIQEKKITMTDFKIMLGICRMTRFGNCVSLSQSGLAEFLGMNKSMISRSIKKLIESHMLIQSSMGLFVNPSLMIKGKLTEVDTEIWDETLKAGFKSPVKSVIHNQLKREKIDQIDLPFEKKTTNDMGE